MKQSSRLFKIEQPAHRPINWGDIVVLVGVAVFVYAGVRLALDAPVVIKGPTISLSPGALPWYASLSIGRMVAAYALAMLFTLVYGSLAANNRRAEKILIPLLDVLQGIPIFSFLPVVLLGFSAILPGKMAAELASIVLIFTSQVWNLTFAWYQSLTTIPGELREASAVFRFNTWLRFKTLELPFAAISLIWNSMMSWAGGWFFLMAAETFTVGHRDFRLPGLGAYLQEAANQGNLQAIAWGIGTLVLVIIILDQLVWRPLLAWADRFKLEMAGGENPPASWLYNALRSSRLIDWLIQATWHPARERLDAWLLRRFSLTGETARAKTIRPWPLYLVGTVGGLGLLYGAFRAGQMLLAVPLIQWGAIGIGVMATLLRVLAALVIALVWTVPLGVVIGSNPRLAAWLQPVVQITASVPATALFPIVLLVMLALPGGLNLSAVLLMLMGTQWYLLFNVIAGATAIPRDLKYTTALLQLSRWQRWRTLILPALFPYIITGAITASGGAWNASIVAEHTEFGGRTMATIGIGASIAQATARGDYPLLLAATLSMIITVVAINRLVWRRLYRLAEEKYRME
ncbi:MAG: ABC transporter permease subunit [Deltaproteobacteria bacterium]|jgi:NitT/TauT family transport system permease protein|nr:ABC transporter permease subunit [Deltaproteobacteria bacterium]